MNQGAIRSAQGQNPLCGDQVTIYLTVDGDCVRDVRWQAMGCAISRTSASILTAAIKDKSTTEVRALFDKVHNLVTTGNGIAS